MVLHLVREIPGITLAAWRIGIGSAHDGPVGVTFAIGDGHNVVDINVDRSVLVQDVEIMIFDEDMQLWVHEWDIRDGVVMWTR